MDSDADTYIGRNACVLVFPDSHVKSILYMYMLICVSAYTYIYIYTYRYTHVYMPRHPTHSRFHSDPLRLEELGRPVEMALKPQP